MESGWADTVQAVVAILALLVACTTTPLVEWVRNSSRQKFDISIKPIDYRTGGVARRWQVNIKNKSRDKMQLGNFLFYPGFNKNNIQLCSIVTPNDGGVQSSQRLDGGAIDLMIIRCAPSREIYVNMEFERDDVLRINSDCGSKMTLDAGSEENMISVSHVRVSIMIVQFMVVYMIIIAVLVRAAIYS